MRILPRRITGRAAAVLVGALLVAVIPAGAQAPVRTENLVYSVLAFTGRAYNPTFAREDSEAVYLIEGVDSFVTIRKTFVYFWPITGEWKTDTNTLDVPLEGTLEVTDHRGRTVPVVSTRYTYYNEKGPYELNWKVAQGSEADQVWSRWSQRLDAYRAASRDYREQLARIGAERASLISRIEALRGKGGDVTTLVDRLAEVRDPQPPQPPQDYVVPPTEIREAFILNLPRGQYSLRLRNPDGSIMERSEKTLVVHARRRSSGIGYEVIPGDKWTRPVQSPTPSSVLYVDGSSDLYLRPYFEDEYNDLYYARTVRNDDRGNPNLVTWQRIQQVPGASIRIVAPGAPPVRIQEEPWFVEQLEGATLGYRIVPYTAKGSQEDQEPSMVAIRVPLAAGARVIRLLAQDGTETALKGSERQIRVVRPPAAEALLPVFGLLPIAALLAVIIIRSRKYKRS